MFRALRRAIIRANRNVVALDDASLEPLLALGVALARGQRVSDEDVAAVFAGIGAGDGYGPSDETVARAEYLSRPQFSQGPRGGNKTAVLSVRGVVTYGLEFQPYAVSAKNLQQNIEALASDDTVKNIVLVFDSPGGTVTGVPEAADAIYKARQSKSVLAYADGLCASAAYWLASQASEISCLGSGDVGSVGVRMAHTDCSAAMEGAGVKVTSISAPEGGFKTEGSPFEPLSPDSLAYFQGEVNAIYSQFIGAVARGRETTPTNVKANFGKGRVVRAADAKKLGMIDRLETSDSAFGRLGLTVGGLAAQAMPIDAIEPEPAEANAADAFAVTLEATDIAEPADQSSTTEAAIEVVAVGDDAAGSGGTVSLTEAVQAVAAEPVEPEPIDPKIAAELEMLRLVVEL